MNSINVSLTDCFGPAYYEIFHDVEARNNMIYWLKGGRGSLKGSFAYLYTIFDLTRDAENGVVTHAVGLRKVGLTIRDSVFTNFLWAINKLGLKDSWDYTISPMKFFHKKTGNTILFRGCANQRDFEKIKSLKFEKGYCKIAIFEELTEFAGMDEIDSIQQSLFRGSNEDTREDFGNEESITFVMYNPPASRKNWVNEESRKLRQLNENGEDTGVYILHTTYLQAPKSWLGKPFVDKANQIKKFNYRKYQHMYLGEETGEGLEIYPPITKDNPNGLVEYRTITNEEIKQFTKINRGLDFGYSHASCYAEMYYDKKQEIIYIIDEVYLYGANNFVLASKIKHKAGKLFIIGDSEDPRTINEMILLGLNVGKAKKGKDSKDHGIMWLKGRAKIVIDKKRTPNIADDFETYEYKKDKEGKIIYDFPEEPDGSASCRYGLEKYILDSKLKFGVKR
jgi:PBSX family phage terminase large subunit